MYYKLLGLPLSRMIFKFFSPSYCKLFCCFRRCSHMTWMCSAFPLDTPSNRQQKQMYKSDKRSLFFCFHFALKLICDKQSPEFVLHFLKCNKDLKCFVHFDIRGPNDLLLEEYLCRLTGFMRNRNFLWCIYKEERKIRVFYNSPSDNMREESVSWQIPHQVPKQIFKNGTEIPTTPLLGGDQGAFVLRISSAMVNLALLLNVFS